MYLSVCVVSLYEIRSQNPYRCRDTAAIVFRSLFFLFEWLFCHSNHLWSYSRDNISLRDWHKVNTFFHMFHWFVVKCKDRAREQFLFNRIISFRWTYFSLFYFQFYSIPTSHSDHFFYSAKSIFTSLKSIFIDF